jgi:hypothetical protein
MISKNMRNIFSAFIMTFLMILIIFSNTIADARIRGSNAISFGDLSEEKEKTIHTSEYSYFYFVFGLMIVDGVITHVEFAKPPYLFTCSPVKKVTLIGIAWLTDWTKNYSILRFYMKTFTNTSVGLIEGNSLKKLEVSVEYQHFSLFVTPFTIVGLSFIQQ